MERRQRGPSAPRPHSSCEGQKSSNTHKRTHTSPSHSHQPQGSRLGPQIPLKKSRHNPLNSAGVAPEPPKIFIGHGEPDERKDSRECQSFKRAGGLNIKRASWARVLIKATAASIIYINDPGFIISIKDKVSTFHGVYPTADAGHLRDRRGV